MRDPSFFLFGDVEGPQVGPPCFPLPAGSLVDEDRVVPLVVFLLFLLAAGFVGDKKDPL